MVWLATDAERGGKEAAVKVVDLQRDENEGVDVTVMREVGVLRLLGELHPHPNLAYMLDFFTLKGKAHLVFDRAECNLHEWQRRLPNKVVPHAQAASIASQMWSALEHLHKLDVLHRDVNRTCWWRTEERASAWPTSGWRACRGRAPPREGRTRLTGW